MQDIINLNKQIEALIQKLLDDPNHADNLYPIFIKSIEKPLIETVLRHTGGNQTAASKILGISRVTLRSKISKI